MLIDVRHMQDVEIDPAARRVRVGAGVKWERVAPQLSELGLAGLHGSSPDVGVAGYSLGGGIGWLARKHGMQTNSVTAIEIVLADGRHVRTDAVHEPELFWALRGGNGNFGVVTAIEFAVYPLAEVYAGAMFFPFERSRRGAAHLGADAPVLPDELMTWANSCTSRTRRSCPSSSAAARTRSSSARTWAPRPRARSCCAPIRDLGPAIDTFGMHAPEFLGELAMDPPDPLPIELGHQLMDELPAEAVDAILEAAGPGSDAPLAMVQLRHMGGALSRVAPARRRPRHAARRGLPARPRRDLRPRLPRPGPRGDRPHRARRRRRGARATTRTSSRSLPDASAFFDAATWERLRRVKAQYDPTSLFRGNHAIPAAAEADSGQIAA